jgi:repressor LexA
MAQPLTPVEKRVYDYLLDFLTENTYQPSIREIGRQFRIKSTKTVSDILQSLAAKGYIERDAARSRGVRLIGYAGASQVRPVPCYGRVAAGEPSLLPEHREGFITLDRRFVPNEYSFFLKVKGDSMIGRAIADGDFVLVDPERLPREGDVVAARLGDEATVKTYRQRDGRVVLEAANPAERDIVVDAGADFGILGVLAGVFRPLVDSGPAPVTTFQTLDRAGEPGAAVH